MAENSKIQWTKHTWNPLYGCRKVSKGCKFCYAERLIVDRQNGEFTKVRRTGKDTWNFPYKEHKKLTGAEPFTERLVFTCSMSDFFIEEGDAHRADMWRVIRETPNLIYQILTKRPERIMDHLPEDWGSGYENVWLGTSVEDQDAMDLRVPILAKIPAKVRFLSIEPLIGRVDPIKTTEIYNATKAIDWVIIGGESGNDTIKGRPAKSYRPCDLTWIAHCIASFSVMEIPFFLKQFGTHLAKELKMSDRKGGVAEEVQIYYDLIRESAGANIDKIPLNPRQFPKAYQ